MARTLKTVWLVSGVLIVAACGGGDDDASPDPGTVAPDAATSTEPDATDDGSVAVDEPSAPDSGGEDGATGDDDDAGTPVGFGPALEPSATFAFPASATPVGENIAVSPTGDRVAVMWIAEADFATNLAVYDAATGSELASIADDRLDGDLFWTSDDRLISVGNFGVVWAWDSATLASLSEDPLSEGEPGCAGGNGTRFDPVAGALFLKSDSLCRIDVTTGASIQYTNENPTTLLAVAIGGNEVYLRGTDTTGELVLRVLDATTLEVVSDEPSDGPNPVVAASVNGVIEQEPGGFGYVVQPSGRAVDFNTSGIETSAGGTYYVSGFDGGKVVISSADGSTIGTFGEATKTAWSADDSVLAARTEAGVSVYGLG